MSEGEVKRKMRTIPKLDITCHKSLIALTPANYEYPFRFISPSTGGSFTGFLFRP